MTWRLPVEETFTRSDLPVAERLAKAAVPVEEMRSVPLVRKEVVAFTMSAVRVPEIMPAAEVTEVVALIVVAVKEFVMTAESSVARPVVLNVPTWKLPEPVAFVKVMLVEETVVARSVLKEALPARVRVPVAEILAWDDEFTWKFRKSPEKTAGLIPMYVPEAALPP